jgi:SAM-dependent methyltransferase
MSTDSTYTFANSWEHAQRRLQLLEEIYDPGTFRRLERVGVGAGWRCLEIGGGGGSIARWLCRQVGPEGLVVATDLDTRFLNELGLTNLEVLRHDVVEEPLPPGPFDLIHARAVLMHLPVRVQVLGKLAEALRPGGWLVLEDGDRYGRDGLATGEFREIWQWLDKADPPGVDLAWGRLLPERMVAAGLIDVRAESEVPLFPGRSAGSEFARLTLTQVWERLLAAGAPADLLERISQRLDVPDQWFPAPAAVGAWGRRPLA